MFRSRGRGRWATRSQLPVVTLARESECGWRPSESGDLKREPLWDEGQANRQRMEETAEYLREERMREAATSLKLPSREDHQRDLERIKGEIRREREEWTQKRKEAAWSRKKEMEEEEKEVRSFPARTRQAGESLGGVCGKKSGGTNQR